MVAVVVMVVVVMVVMVMVVMVMVVVVMVVVVKVVVMMVLVSRWHRRAEINNKKHSPVFYFSLTCVAFARICTM